MKQEPGWIEIGCGCLFALAIWFGAMFVASWLMMTVWNFIIPPLFGGPALELWQAAAVYILLSFIAALFRSR